MKIFAPSQDDIMRCRMRTTGIIEMNMEIEGLNFQFIDVGGQKSERRKWNHCFDNVNSIIFLAALDEYNLKMDEDHETNRFHDTIELYKSILSETSFRRIPIMLFLNKCDLFEKKIKKHPISEVFNVPAEEVKSYTSSLTYISSIFEKVFNESGNPNKVFHHFITCALDTTCCKTVFDTVRIETLKIGYEIIGL